MSKLKIVGGILLIVLFIFLIRSIIIDEKSFNQIDLSFSTNTIQNYSSVAYLDTITHVGMHELEMDNLSIMLLDIPNHIIHKIMVGEQVNGFVLQLTDSLYQVYINPKLSRRQHINIVSHEIIHIQQNSTRRLIMLESPFVIWEGDTLNVNQIDYMDREWETEAYRIEGRIERKIRQILY